jgi:hypothetical protein
MAESECWSSVMPKLASKHKSDVSFVASIFHPHNLFTWDYIDDDDDDDNNNHSSAGLQKTAILGTAQHSPNFESVSQKLLCGVKVINLFTFVCCINNSQVTSSIFEFSLAHRYTFDLHACISASVFDNTCGTLHIKSCLKLYLTTLLCT